jgi:4'-phosphopantetheinyl transferase
MNVYIIKWNKEDAPWQRILADILKRDYKIEQCPEILKDEMGKPYLHGNPLYFNVSHSGEYLAIAISKHLVGIDIQEPKFIKDGMFRKVVQPEEDCLIGADRQKDFLRLWTLKESFVKADGKGLRIALKDYHFTKENGKYFVIYGGQRLSWTFNIEETLIENYFISVCGKESEVKYHFL